MEIWFVKMSTGDNPLFAVELAMRQACCSLKFLFFLNVERENFNDYFILF